MPGILQSNIGRGARTMSNPITEGHLLIAAIGDRGAVTVDDVMTAEGYTAVEGGVLITDNGDNSSIWYKTAGPSESVHLPTTTESFVAWLELGDSAGPTDSDSDRDSGGGGGWTATPTTPPITAAAGDFCIAVATEGTDGGWGAHSYTPPAGWNEIVDNNHPTDHPTTWMGWKISSGGSEAAAPVCNGSGYWTAMIASFGFEPLPPTEPPVIDIYDPDDILLATLSSAFDIKFRPELNGTGSGEFKINRHDPAATSDILKEENFVRVTVPQIDPNPIFGFFLEAGDFTLVDTDEEGGEIIQFSGRGGLAYWDRAIWLSESFLNPWWIGGTPTATDIGQIHFNAGTYLRYTVSGGQASQPIHFTTGGFTAFYDIRKLFKRTTNYSPDKGPITLVHLSNGSHAGWYVHPYGPGVTDRRKKSTYTIGPSVLMSNISTNQRPGEVIYQMYQEAVDAGRPINPIPGMTIDFSATLDSDGNAWTTTDAMDAVSANLGDDYLSTIGQLIQTGAIDVYMDPDLGMHAYNAYGRDLSALDFAANKVIFRRGWNIADRLKRIYDDPPVGTFAEVLGNTESVIARVTLAVDRPPREISVRGDTDDTTALAALGTAQLEQRLLHSDTIAFRVDTPVSGMEDETQGRYLPGPEGTARGNYWLGDIVNLDTGEGVHDFDNDDVRIWAITFEWDAANNMKITVEVGSGFGGLPAMGDGTHGTTAGGFGGGSGTLQDTFQELSEKDNPNGYAGLDDNGNIFLTELGNLQWKNSVRVAATTDLTLSAIDDGAVVDGVTLAEGDDFLAPAQATGSENGVYLVQEAGEPPTRRTDMDADLEVWSSAFMVREGDTYGGSLWRNSDSTPQVVDTDDLDFTQFLPDADVAALNAAVFGFLDHGNTGATETFDASAAGWHKATLDSATVTATFTGAVASSVASMVLELVQDGTGGRAIDFPASVINGSSLEASLDLTAAGTTYYVFFSHDGGSNWIGFVMGGGSTASDVAVWKPVMASSPNVLTTDAEAIWLVLVTVEGEPIMAFVPL